MLQTYESLILHHIKDSSSEDVTRIQYIISYTCLLAMGLVFKLKEVYQ